MNIKDIGEYDTLRERIIKEIAKQYDGYTQKQFRDLRSASFINEDNGLERQLHIENKNGSYLDLSFSDALTYDHCLVSFGFGGFDAPYVGLKSPKKKLMQSYQVDFTDGRQATLLAGDSEIVKDLEEGKSLSTTSTGTSFCALHEIKDRLGLTYKAIKPLSYVIVELSDEDDTKILEKDYIVLEDVLWVSKSEFDTISLAYDQLLEILENVGNFELRDVIESEYEHFKKEFEHNQEG